MAPLLLDDRSCEAEASNATINRDLTALAQLLAYGELWGVCVGNPAKTFNRRLATREKRDNRSLPSREQMEQVASRCPPGFGDLVRFALFSGRRQNEICMMNWSGVACRPPPNRACT